MKKIVLILIAVASFISSFAQNSERPNTIRADLFPTYNSDYSYFFVRRDMRLNELLAGTEVTTSEDGTVDVRTKAIFPLYDSEKVSFTVPIYYDRYGFKGDDNGSDLGVNHLFGQTVLTYRPNKKWDILQIFEFRFKGVNDYFFEKEGNFLANFVMARYKLSDQFNLVGGGLIGVGWDQNGKSYTRTRPSFAVQWRPNEHFDLMLGLPGAALEWSAPAGFDLTVNTLLEGGDVNVTAALRKKFGDHFDITGRYLREGYSELYTPADAATFLPSETEQITQYPNKYQLEFTIRPERNTVVQFIGGYGQNRDLKIMTTNGTESSVGASDGYYFGINLQKTILLNTQK